MGGYGLQGCQRLIAVLGDAILSNSSLLLLVRVKQTLGPSLRRFIPSEFRQLT